MFETLRIKTFVHDVIDFPKLWQFSGPKRVRSDGFVPS